MGFITYDIEKAYQQQFGRKPKVPDAKEIQELNNFKLSGNNPQTLSANGSALTAEYLGQEIWLPIKFYDLDVNIFGVPELLLPYATIKISSKKNIVKTPLVERRGTVKEQYSVEDFQISIKGFLIGNNNGYPVFPEAELLVLKNLYFLNEAVKLDNAKSNIFLDTDTRVVIEGLELPEVESGKKNYCPFSFNIESDSIFTLEIA